MCHPLDFILNNHLRHKCKFRLDCNADPPTLSSAVTIRLLNGTDHCSGRVEIFQGGHWAPVYSTNWGLNEALVVCKEMQCGEPVVASTSPYFGLASQGTGYTAICSGRESSISQCSLRGYTKTSRDHAVEATVVCSGENSLGSLRGRETTPMAVTISYIVITLSQSNR